MLGISVTIILILQSRLVIHHGYCLLQLALWVSARLHAQKTFVLLQKSNYHSRELTTREANSIKGSRIVLQSQVIGWFTVVSSMKTLPIENAYLGNGHSTLMYEPVGDVSGGSRSWSPMNSETLGLSSDSSKAEISSFQEAHHNLQTPTCWCVRPLHRSLSPRFVAQSKFYP